MFRFLAGENVDGNLIHGLSVHIAGIDLVRAVDVGLDHTPDPVILEWAALGIPDR